MDRTDVDWRGYWPAAPTPYGADGEVDYGALADLMQLYVGQGVSGILVNGSTGEWFSQTPEERRRVCEHAVASVAGAVPVLVGVSAYTAAEAGQLARHAQDAGADGVLATPPPYVHPSAEETVGFYVDVTAASSLPFAVYNWPRGVVVDLAQTPGLLRRLAELDHVVAVKDSTGDGSALARTAREVSPVARVLGGFLNDAGLDLLLDGLGDGNIDGGGVGAPFAVPFYAAIARGDRAAATVELKRYEQLASGLVRSDYSARYASPIPQLKAVMRLLGQPGGHVRPPLRELDDPAVLATLRRHLSEAGLL